jgi:acyl carrier protein
MQEQNVWNELASIAGMVMQEVGLSGDIDWACPLGAAGLGLDSIGRLKLLAEVEEKMNVSIPEKYWGNDTFQSLREMHDFIVRLKHSEPPCT